MKPLTDAKKLEAEKLKQICMDLAQKKELLSDLLNASPTDCSCPLTTYNRGYERALMEILTQLRMCGLLDD